MNNNFNPTLVQFKLVLSKKQRKNQSKNFNPTLVQFKQQILQPNYIIM